MAEKATYKGGVEFRTSNDGTSGSGFYAARHIAIMPPPSNRSLEQLAQRKAELSVPMSWMHIKVVIVPDEESYCDITYCPDDLNIFHDTDKVTAEIQEVASGVASILGPLEHRLDMSSPEIDRLKTIYSSAPNNWVSSYS